MKFRFSYLLIILTILSSCGSVIGMYLTDSSIKPEYLIKPGKSYVFGRFLEANKDKSVNINDGSMVLVVMNRDNKKEYRILLTKTNAVQCFEVTPGNFVIEKFAFLASYQSKRWNYLTNENFTVHEGEIEYIGDYEGDSEMNYQQVSMIEFYSHVFNTNSVNKYEEMTYSDNGVLSSYGMRTYTWEINSISNNYDKTKEEFLKLYPQFKDFKFTSRFE